MSDEPIDLIENASENGMAASYPDPPAYPMLAGPSTGEEFNVLKDALRPVACCSFGDGLFAFDSSFVGPEITENIGWLAALREKHRLAEYPPLGLFGHDDPSGEDDYNKQLSGRRVSAVYALLTRNTALWEDLFLHPLGRDNWKHRAIQVMLARLGYYDGPLNGELDTPTREAVQAFQGSPEGEGLAVDGDPGSKTRPKLYRAYMAAVCTYAPDQPTLTLDPTTDFLARGADAGGKGDYQGCGEFNPLLMFSAAENAEFEKPENKEARDQENTPNRRVVAFLFKPGVVVDPVRWPCPRVKEGVALCHKRFWSDAPKRRSFQAERREYEKTYDTFACRFYQRIADYSPCERAADDYAMPLQWITHRYEGDRVEMELIVRDLNGNELRRSAQSGTCVDETGTDTPHIYDLTNIKGSAACKIEVVFTDYSVVPKVIIQRAMLRQAFKSGDAATVAAAISLNAFEDPPFQYDVSQEQNEE
jgi:hypothetical protein